jgi:hypothetical protein
MITRTDRVQGAILAALEKYAASINAAPGMTHLHIDVKFDRTSGLPHMAIVSMGMETRVREISLEGFTFASEV